MLFIGFFYQLRRLLEFGIHELLLQLLMLEHFIDMLGKSQISAIT